MKLIVRELVHILAVVQEGGATCCQVDGLGGMAQEGTQTSWDDDKRKQTAYGLIFPMHSVSCWASIDCPFSCAPTQCHPRDRSSTATLFLLYFSVEPKLGEDLT